MEKTRLYYRVYILVKLERLIKKNSQIFHSEFDIRVEIIIFGFAIPTDGLKTIASVLIAFKCKKFKDIQARTSVNQASKVFRGR